MRSKAVVYSILSILFAAAVFVVAWMYFSFIMGKDAEEQPEKIYSHYYAMVTDDYRSSFWQYVWKGASEEAAEKDAYVELFGSDLGNDYSIEELMEMAIAAKVDGIMVYGNSSENMVDLIDKATGEGIPVVTMYSDCPFSERCSYVGVSGYNIGLEYGRQICSAKGEIERLAGDDPDRKKNTYTVTVLAEEKKPFYDQNVILSGIKDIVNRDESGAEYNIRILSVDNSNPFSVEESIRDIFMEEEIPDHRTPEDHFGNRERNEAIRLCMERIDPKMKEALWLVYIEDLSYEAAAKIMGVGRKRIDKLLQTGKERMRSELDKEGVTK